MIHQVSAKKMLIKKFRPESGQIFFHNESASKINGS